MQHENQLLDEVLLKAGIQEWDVLIVGDGSGSGWNGACGWCSILVDKLSRGRRVFYGAMNNGSVNVAETMPYIQSLMWFDNQMGSERIRTGKTVHVHIITDSQTTASWGNTAKDVMRSIPKKAVLFGSYVRELSRVGYIFHFHWAPRMESNFNWAADMIAGLSRDNMMRTAQMASGDSTASHAAKLLSAVTFQDPKSKEHIDVYEICPDV